MKKFLLLTLLISLILSLSGCKALREKILAPPDEMEIPEGSLIAVCTVDDNVYTHIYKGDGIYIYYINDVLQGDEAIEYIQEQAFLNGESVDNYLKITYKVGECVIDDYVDEDKEK